jgi:hypothetical protein
LHFVIALRKGRANNGSEDDGESGALHESGEAFIHKDWSP